MFSSKKHLLLLLIIFFLLANAHIVLAEEKECNGLDPTATIDPTYIVKCVLNKLGISDETIEDTTGSLDVARFKKPQPEVTIVFTPNDPIYGEKVTASAQPMYFGNQPESLYYTWYLQTADCPPNPDKDDTFKKLYPAGEALDLKCNLNKDHDSIDGESYGIVDIEDYKIKAMRIYANNGFEWDLKDAVGKTVYDITTNDTDGYSAIKGGDDQQGKNDFCFFQNTKDGTQTSLPCFHFFPNAKGYTTGDENFKIKEEEFWHTDPNNPDTAGTGHPDEANVAGLGAKDFSWTYQSGDQIGIVIEGVSVDATKKAESNDKADSSFKIMWAFLNGKCSSAVTGEKTFNECLLKNMLAPTEGGGKNEKIEVSLSFSPTNPVNDKGEGDNADWINVVSIIENSTKTESLDYAWTVYAGQSADTDGTWTSLLKSQLAPLGIEQTVGAGIPNLNFKANFGDDTPSGTSTTAVPKYLKVKLNVLEKVTSGTGTDTEKGTRKGRAEVIIPLSSFDNKLSAFNTSVDTSLNLAIKKKDSTNDEICKIPAGTDGMLVNAAICQVAPDEIVAVKADIVLASGETWNDYDFLWTLNDQPLSYKYDPLHDDDPASGKLSFKPNNEIFFPVLAPKGSPLNLSLVATNKKTGNKISLAKTFLVSEPTFKIISTDRDTAKSKLLGNYLDLEGKSWPDYSQTEFWAKKDSAIKLSVEQFASSPLPSEEDLDLSPSPLKWYWNDTELTATGRTIIFTPSSDTTDSFSLSAKGLYTQDINTKKALNKYWDVQINEFHEESLSGKIDFTVAGATVFDEMAAAKNAKQKILASFISSVPAYFAFLFRIVMTAFVMLAAIWILFSLFPQTEKND